MAALDYQDMLLIVQQSLSNKRVLIVDRRASARDSLRATLHSLGFVDVLGAADSAEAFRQIHAERFDIIFSDYVLDGGRNGQQLLEELRHAH